MSMSAYQKLIKGPFIKYIELHLRARDEPSSVTLKLLTKSNNEQKLMLWGHLHKGTSLYGCPFPVITLLSIKFDL